MSSKRTVGINGYVGKKAIYKAKHRPGWKGRMMRKKAFTNKIQRALEAHLLEESQYIVNSGQVLQSTNQTTYGTQNYGSIVIQLSYADINGIFNQIKAGGSGVPALTSAVQKYTITSSYVEIMMKNQENCSCIVDLYEVIPRHDNSTTPTACFGGGLTDQGSTGTDVQWGLTPYQSNAFCVQYKILSKTRYLLAPGACELFTARDNKKKFISTERLTRGGSMVAASSLSGITKHYFAVVRGEPSNDSVTKTAVTTTPFKVIFANVEIYNYQYAINNTVFTDYVNSFSGATTLADTNLQTGTSITPATS